MRKEFGWIVLVLVLVSLACTLGGGSQESIITVEISSPQPGETVAVGQEVFIVASAVAQSGVDKVYLSINGQIVGKEEPEGLPQTHVTNFSWTPIAEGQVVVAVVATDGEGQTSEASSIYVNVAAAFSEAGSIDDIAADESPTETLAPQEADAPSPSDTPELPTATFTPEPTDAPTVTPSPTSGFIIGTLVLPPVVFLPSVQTVWDQISFPNNDTANVTAACPEGTTVMSGGFATNQGVYVYTQLMKSNGWQAFASNYTGSSKTLSVFAVCASNIAGASVQQVFQQGTISGNSNGNVVAECPFGSTVVGGGYASKSDQTLKVYNSTKKNNGWQVYATNSKGSGQALNAYAICLSSDPVTSSTMVYQNVIISGGSTGGQSADCDSGLRTGGGFAIQTGLEVYNSSPKNLTWEGYASNTTGSNKTMNVYAICLTFD